MAEPTTSAPSGVSQKAAPKPPPPPKPQNPALRMLGLPNIRLKLPSRNWLIFLSITGSFTTALVYDRRQKRRAQEKWSNLVAHIAKEPLRTNEARRKLTIFLAAPPGDGLRSAREYFKEYIKPILVAGALDYEVLEGRREGDIRAAVANRIRKTRRQAGEGQPIEEDEADNFLQQIRQNFGIEDEPVIKGDVVIGRHTWKEYIRGIHEGWLGPMDAPAPEPEASPNPEPSPINAASPPANREDGSPTCSEQPQENKEAEPTPEKTPEEKKKEEKKPSGPTPAYIFPAAYPSQQLAPSIPQEIDASPVAFPHILGFLNTPIRIYRFVTQRYLADAIGRDVATIVLAASTRPYAENNDSVDYEFAASATATTDDASPSSPSLSSSHQFLSKHYEQQTLLESEEQEWPKSVRKQKEHPDIKEREWLDDVVMDSRIASRMRRFDLPAEDEERAQRIGEGTEWIRGEEMPVHIPTWKRIWNTYGWGEEDDGRPKVIIGNLDGEDGE
ncbi:mitochondrial import inner membrane translocase subunit tim54 [Blastomyces dermatitidis ER-3]|uniref:Mitochondrial import inner membrane translocase subunit TIM54 n=1 Tax=Ajellomyces dermatitidis (strain ER-3 / ATCC MYA-2586) TaxID=559297 RepID=A0ABP2ER22_AJEDR|nr:mitochondrial import inner membrane translocase subunit tim54 [Blastomyces dermatitidis ER-3]EEQ85613.2 mitochondrial import inner membrane translocase subunit tim54 [Blastomyces dermatitidis ER-3]